MEFNECKMKVIGYKIDCNCNLAQEKRKNSNESYKSILISENDSTGCFEDFKIHFACNFIHKIRKRVNETWESIMKTIFESVLCEDFGSDFPLQFEHETDVQAIIRKLSLDSFYECSCLIILFNMECKCSMKIYSEVFNAITDNENLKYVSKLFITRPFYNNFNDECRKLFIRRLYTYSDFKDTIALLEPFEKENQQFYENCFTAIQDLCKGVNNHINLFLSPQFQESGELLKARLFKYIFSAHHQYMSIQNIVNYVNVTHCLYMGNMASNLVKPSIVTQKNMDFYLYQINPALAVIINHLNVNGFSVRNGSEYDVKVLRKTFQRKNIPHLIVPDGSAEEVRTIMSKLRTYNLRSLKYLYLFVMSHGDENGNVLGSRTDPYSLEEDIIAPLLANETLADTEKCVVIQACRGPRGSIWDSHPDDFVYKPTNTQTLDEKLVKLYATLPGHKAYRYPDSGSPVIQQFCQQFKKQFEEVSIEDMKEEMERHLLNNSNYDYQGNWTKIMELCVKPNTKHIIKNEFVNKEDLKWLIQEFCELVKGDNLNE